jgi:hypothetical protein
VLYEALKAAILSGEISVHPQFLPSNYRVFGVMFLHRALSEPLIRIVTDSLNLTINDPIAEHMNNIVKALEQSIVVDISFHDVPFTCIYTVDMQRSYFKKRVRNRIVYYGSKELSDQEVIAGRYENLKRVSITFILEDNTTPSSPAVSKIQFTNVVTHEVYSDLLTLYEVNLNVILKTEGLPELLYTLAAFLTIKTHEDLCNFVNSYDNDYSKRLVVEYMQAILRQDILNKLGNGKYATKEYQNNLMQEYEDGREDGRIEERMELAKTMFLEGEIYEKILKYSKLNNDDLLEVLTSLPESVQNHYNLTESKK